MKSIKCLLWVAFFAVAGLPSLVLAQTASPVPEPSPASKQIVINGFVGQNIPIEISEPDTVVIDRRDVVTYMEEIPDDELRPIVTALKQGVARVTVTKGGEVTVFRLVIEDPDQADQVALIKEMVADEALKVRFVGESIVLEGEVANDLTVRKAMNIAAAFSPQVLNFMTMKETMQVRIKVRVLEVNLNKDSTIGLQYGQGRNYNGIAAELGLSSIASAPFFAVTNINPALAFTGATTKNSENGGVVVGPGTNSVPTTPGVSGVADGLTPVLAQQFDITARLNLMLSSGLAKVLQEPELTVLNGQPAVFRVGGEFPIVQRTVSDGQTSFSAEYRPFGISLLLTPIVEEYNGLNEGRYADVLDTQSLPQNANLPFPTAASIDEKGTINLFVRPEISEPVFDNVTADIPFPTLNVQTVETRVSLKHNESLVIGGLFNESFIKNIQKVPFISKIPILGELFKNRINADERREIFFVLTPKVVGREDVVQGDRPLTRLSETNEYMDEREVFSPAAMPTRISAGEIWVRPEAAQSQLQPVEWNSVTRVPMEAISPRPDQTPSQEPEAATAPEMDVAPSAP